MSRTPQCRNRSISNLSHQETNLSCSHQETNFPCSHQKTNLPCSRQELCPSHSRPHSNTHALSENRPPKEGEGVELSSKEENEEEETTPKNVDSLSWSEIQTIADYLLEQTPIDSIHQTLKPNWIQKHFIATEGKLYRKKNNTLYEVLAEQELNRTAWSIHRESGHTTAGKLYSLVSQKFWHPELLLIVQQVIRTCPNCSLCLPPGAAPQTLEPIKPVPPFHRWGIDFTGPLHLPGVYKYMLNAIDYCTGWAKSHAVLNQTSATVVKMLEKIKEIYGTPVELISDNGPQFVSEDVRDWLEKNGVAHH